MVVICFAIRTFFLEMGAVCFGSGTIKEPRILHSKVLHANQRQVPDISEVTSDFKQNNYSPSPLIRMESRIFLVQEEIYDNDLKNFVALEIAIGKWQTVVPELVCMVFIENGSNALLYSCLKLSIPAGFVTFFLFFHFIFHTAHTKIALFSFWEVIPQTTDIAFLCHDFKKLQIFLCCRFQLYLQRIGQEFTHSAQ